MTSRRSRDQVLLDCAYAWSTRSTCERGQIGAVIAIDGRAVSSGYNGTPAGMRHCDHTCICVVGKYTEVMHKGQHAITCPSDTPCKQSVHAEANTIAFAARYGVATAGGTIYTTVSPCVDCAKLIINAGLIRCVYGSEYRLRDGIDLLESAKLEVVHVR